MAKKRLFSGVQPSGELHIGNYIGALKQFVELQDEYESFFCVVDYHAITVPQDPKELRERIRAVTNTYLALGIDPTKSSIFIQSDVSEHAELAWILNNFTYMGELERMTQYKEKSFVFGEQPSPVKSKQNQSVGVGLFDYPVLMAADILLYDTVIVPVGEDQKQHVELTRTIANRFNKRFGKTFVIPDVFLTESGVRIMGLDDPTKKMSKSETAESHALNLFDTESEVRKKISRATTDSGKDIRYDPKKKPGISNLLTIFSALSGNSTKSLEASFKDSSYSEFKDALTFEVVNFLTSFQESYKALENDPAYTKMVLKEGAERARAVASKKLAEVKDKIGVGI